MNLLNSRIVGGAALLLMFVPIRELKAADPAEAETIGRIVRERDDLSSLQALLEKTKLGSDLSKRTDGRFTLFAPTNEAFKKLPKGAAETLLAPQNNERLEEVFNLPREPSLPGKSLDSAALACPTSLHGPYSASNSTSR